MMLFGRWNVNANGMSVGTLKKVYQIDWLFGSCEVTLSLIYDPVAVGCGW